MHKKILALAVSFAMLLGIMVPMASAANTIADDVAGTQYEEAAYLLGALNIMVGDEDGEFRPEDTIIRSEFAKIAVALANLSDIAINQNKSRFPDVNEGHWATGYINVADAQKFVIGYEDGTFRPDDKITYAEAITILIRVMGYEPKAGDNGVYPTGYMVTAAQNGLSRGINLGAYDEATRGLVAELAYNALTIEMMVKTGYGSNEYYEVSDKTLLKDYLNVVKKYGQVIANNETSFETESSLRDDEVLVKTTDGKTDIYKVGKTNAKDLLGYNVVLYSKEVTTVNDKILVLVRPDNSKMSEMKITSGNLQSVSGDADSKKIISYWLNKETDRTPKKATVSSTAKVFYNGVASEEFAVENMMDYMNSGFVTLLDTNKDDEYDLVFITKYVNYVVEDTSLTGYTITDKGTNPTLTLDPLDRDIKFTITKNGEPVELKDIKEFDVLSVAMSGNTPDTSKVIKVIVNDQIVQGKVSELSEDEYTIDGQDYELALNLLNDQQHQLGLEDEGTFYLDAEGKIAWFVTNTTTSDNYAFLVTGQMSSSIDNKLQLKMFTKEGNTEVKNAAEKVRLNKKTTLTGAEALAELKKTADAAFSGISDVAQLIVFETNSKGEINAINTAVDNTANKSELKDTFSKDVSMDEMVYTGGSKKLDRYNVNNNTIIFDIPKTSTGTNTEDFSIRTISMFIDKNTYDGAIYNLTADMTTRAMVIMNSDGDTNAESPIAIVDRITETQNSEGTEVQKLYAVVNGEKTEVLAKDSSTLVDSTGAKLAQGDIIQYKLNAKGEIDKVSVLFKAADKDNADKFTTVVDERNDVELVYGIVDKKFAGSINVKNANGITNYATSDVKVYSYDASKSSNQVSIVDASQVQRYDAADPRAVFVRIYKNQVQEIVIVKLQAPINF